MELIKWVALFLILSGFIHLASGFEYSQLQWGPGVHGKLQRGEVISYGGYSVEVIDFPMPVKSYKYRAEPEEMIEPFVTLNISKNGSFIGTVVLGLESNVVSNNELKVAVKQLPSKNSTIWLYESYSPWALIELSPRGTPDIKVLISTKNNVYTPSSDAESVTTVQLKNTGFADAKNIDMSIVTDLPVNREGLKYHYDAIKINESITENLTFTPPYLLEPKNYSLLVNVSWYDVMDILYTNKYNKTVTITAEQINTSLFIRKSVSNKTYLGDHVMVSLSLRNNRKDNLKNVSIIDSIPDSSILISNTTLHWVANISAGEEWNYRYLIKPQESNIDGVKLPSAIANFTIKNKFYSIQSNQPKIKVVGPKIVLTKQANVSETNPNENVNVVLVTVVAENTGNAPTKVLIKDVLPENATIISGNTTYEKFLESNKKVSFNYSIRINSTLPIRLPPVTANYFELGKTGGKISAISQELIIGNKNASKKILPELTPEAAKSEPMPENNTTMPVNESSGNFTNLSNFERNINAILNFIFGCDENKTSNFSSYVCNFFSRDKNTSSV